MTWRAGNCVGQDEHHLFSSLRSLSSKSLLVQDGKIHLLVVYVPQFSSPLRDLGQYIYLLNFTYADCSLSIFLSGIAKQFSLPLFK